MTNEELYNKIEAMPLGQKMELALRVAQSLATQVQALADGFDKMSSLENKIYAANFINRDPNV